MTEADYAKALLDAPDLWASIVFGHEVPDFHSHLWQFLADESIRYLVIELPGGHGKSSIISTEFPIYRLCRDPNDRIALLQKGIEQAKGVVSTIQREMVHNQNLISLYGQFKPLSDAEGYPWSTTTLRISHNSDRMQRTNSIHAFGWSSTDVMGHRFKCFLGDDFVTADNSDTPEKRARIATKEQTEWTKTLIGAESPRYILMGTPMFFDDAFEAKRPHASDYLGPEDWRLPDEVDKSGVVFIRRSAERGKVSGKTLWPKQMDWPDLEREKKLGYVNYLRRLCCEVGDPSLSVFKEVAIRGGYEEATGMRYPGCLDHEAVIGKPKDGWRVVCGADPSSGKKTGAAGQFAHITLGVDEKADTYHLIDIFTNPVPMSRREDNTDPQDKKSQIGTIIHRHHKYRAAFTVIEENAQQYAWITSVREADGTVRIRTHKTGRNKLDKEVGVESMAGLIESGKLKLPYGNDESRRLVDELIQQLVQYPFHSLSDLVMALWFCVLYAKKKPKVRFYDFYKLRGAAKELRAAS